MPIINLLNDEHTIGKILLTGVTGLVGDHRDIVTAMQLALDGVMDGRIVNIADDAPASVYELAQLVGETLESSAELLANPWYLLSDNSLARRLGFQPVVRTVYQAVQENLM